METSLVSNAYAAQMSNYMNSVHSTKLSGGFKMVDKSSYSNIHSDMIKSRIESRSVSLKSGDFGFDKT
jgi:hypothetical protein